MIADLCFALEQAQIRVMALPAMARITGIAIERLESLCATSPIFGPGAVHYERLGAVQALWTEAQLADALVQALAIPVTAEDPRAALGAARGGRSSASEVIERVLNAP
jgi:malonate decarboxylase gamma subunit